jgi:ketosteroid isomerase-like protein
MSQENVVEQARRIYDHFIATHDVRAETFHPEFVLDMSTFRGWPEQQTYRGIEGLRAFIAAWLEPFDDFEFEVKELRDAGDKVVAVISQRGRSKFGGVPVEMHFAQVMTYRDGKQARVDMYATPAEGLEAAGLSE